MDCFIPEDWDWKDQGIPLVQFGTMTEEESEIDTVEACLQGCAELLEMIELKSIISNIWITAIEDKIKEYHL